MNTVRGTREAIEEHMTKFMCANWQAPAHAEAREAFISECLARRATWEGEQLIDGWIWFRIGFMAACARYK